MHVYLKLSQLLGRNKKREIHVYFKLSRLLGQNEKGQIHLNWSPQISTTIVIIKTGAKLVEEGLCRRCPGGTARSRWLFVIIIDQSSDHTITLWLFEMTILDHYGLVIL